MLAHSEERCQLNLQPGTVTEGKRFRNSEMVTVWILLGADPELKLRGQGFIGGGVAITDDGGNRVGQRDLRLDRNLGKYWLTPWGPLDQQPSTRGVPYGAKIARLCCSCLRFHSDLCARESVTH